MADRLLTAHSCSSAPVEMQRQANHSTLIREALLDR